MPAFTAFAVHGIRRTSGHVTPLARKVSLHVQMRKTRTADV
jgi:hypothetical protein